ncbi:ABC transporter substrate-binding protein [Rhodococcoides kyotonense]|uniref:Iron complex transport system substrate-binding protein n=1 Tax=Rhodococcoides kyotonense TaxID=398843 RepID=A0A239EZ98_9NOCA|nr:ABC transporter substrate-binding protein [Rhodococcus kyotonensis]SNS49917.1 iron complex transport system substrate-binding protein [Rhodococcus kyotonensis]
MKRIVVAALVVAGLVACSSEGEEEASADTRTVTIEHVAGSTTIEGTPERIVALGQQWVDALAEFDVTPVGYIAAGAQGDDRKLFPWQSGLAEDSQMLDSTSVDSMNATPPVEEIAALNPDLILVSGVASADPLKGLNDIAPTVFPEAATVDSWQWQIETLGNILDRQDDAAAIIAEGEAFTDGIVAEYPGLDGKTAVLAQYIVATQQAVAVVNPDDGAAQVFGSIGMSVPADLAASPDVMGGRITFSPERISDLTADLVVMLPNGGTAADLEALPGFNSLPAVAGGGLAVQDYATVVGFNLPSKASIEYSLDRIRPQLEALGS